MKSIFSKKSWEIFFLLLQYPGLRTSEAMRDDYGKDCKSFWMVQLHFALCVIKLKVVVISIIGLIILWYKNLVIEELSVCVAIFYIGLFFCVSFFKELLLIEEHLGNIKNTWDLRKWRRSIPRTYEVMFSLKG